MTAKKANRIASEAGTFMVAVREQIKEAARAGQTDVTLDGLFTDGEVAFMQVSLVTAEQYQLEVDNMSEHLSRPMDKKHRVTVSWAHAG